MGRVVLAGILLIVVFSLSACDDQPPTPTTIPAPPTLTTAFTPTPLVVVTATPRRAPLPTSTRIPTDTPEPTRIPPPPYAFIEELAFADPLHGWVLGKACDSSPDKCVRALYRTTDSGNTWHNAIVPEVGVTVGSETVSQDKLPHQLRFATENDGWAFANGFFTTHDGGHTWTDSSSQIDGTILAIEPKGTTVWAIKEHCTQPDQCANTLLTSTDMGRSWQPAPVQPRLQHQIFRLLRLTEQDAWILSWQEYEYVLVSTHDGGLNWEELPPLPDNKLTGPSDVAATSPTHVWLLYNGSNGAALVHKAIVESTDGGQQWTLIARTEYSDERMPDATVTPHPGPKPIMMLTGYVHDFAVSSPTRMWMSLAYGFMTGSSDGGHNWNGVTVRNEGAKYDDSQYNQIRFVDESNGWINCFVAIVHTTDGGVTWDEEKIVLDRNYQVKNP